MLNGVVLLNIFVETVFIYFQDSLLNRKFKSTAFIYEIEINIIQIFTLNSFNAFFLFSILLNLNFDGATSFGMDRNVKGV